MIEIIIFLLTVLVGLLGWVGAHVIGQIKGLNEKLDKIYNDLHSRVLTLEVMKNASR